MNKSVLFFAFLVVLCFGASAQEYIVPLDNNAIKLREKHSLKNSPKGTHDTIKLPFIDDFTNKGPYADQVLWLDSFVFINTSYGVHPKTFGVATFDALNQYGELYEAAVTSSYQFAADFLTSKPIRLDSLFVDDEKFKLTPADSVMLSFYYQPQGRGFVPQERDSLVLQFLAVAEDKYNNKIEGEDLVWVTVWSATGESLASFSEGDFPFFKRVIVPIEEVAYFRNDFQFRFRNYASVPAGKTPANYAGNTSIWNIDYVYLDVGRSVNNIFYHDIAFVEPAQSILKNYTAMPWQHYTANPQKQLRTNFDVVFANLDQITYNYSYRYFITDEDDVLIKNYSGGSWNIAPFSESGYQDYPAHTSPAVVTNPLPTATADARSFSIYHVIREGAQGDSYQRNDTIVYKQEFLDYYAYDDGVAEAGYGLVGWNPKGAYRYVAAKGDMLESVNFFFNRTKSDVNQKPFYLTVWKSLVPEVVLYQSEIVMVEFEEGLNQFVNYPLSNPVFVVDTFYVGWTQIGSDFLNIGFDVNNNNGHNIFFNADGQWEQSIASGSLMIRPVFNHALSTPSITEKRINEIVVYPNPVKGNIININVEGIISMNSVVQIFDLYGRLLLHTNFAETINLSNLRAGTYLLKIIDSENDFKPVRFIIL
jgi:hypothetical protein